PRAWPAAATAAPRAASSSSGATRSTPPVKIRYAARPTPAPASRSVRTAVTPTGAALDGVQVGVAAVKLDVNAVGVDGERAGRVQAQRRRLGGEGRGHFDVPARFRSLQC